MEGPFYLPESVAEGDYIELAQTGAYGEVMRSNFNGFGGVEKITLEDEPLMGQFAELVARRNGDEVGRSEEEA
jgi:ornithine decarboxylase